MTIATPHHGSKFLNRDHAVRAGQADPPAQDAGQHAAAAFPRQSEDLLFAGSLLRVETSIDSLVPASPIFPLMLAGRRPPWVKYHNIIGEMPAKWWLGSLATHSDGVVRPWTAPGWPAPSRN